MPYKSKTAEAAGTKAFLDCHPLYVRLRNGEVITVRVWDSDSIANVKNKIIDILSLSGWIQPADLRSTFGEQVLQNGRTVSEYNIGRGDTIAEVGARPRWATGGIVVELGIS